MSNISIVLEKLMAIQGLTEAELARRTDVKQPVISRILNGDTENPRTVTLESLANHFNISIPQLLGEEPFPNQVLQKQNGCLVPILSLELVKDWLVRRENITDHHTIKWISTDVTQNEKAFAIQLQSRTMAPMLPNGSVLIFDPNVQPSDGDYVVIEMKDLDILLIKELVLDGCETYLRSPNPDIETIRVKNPYTVLGVMMQARINFKECTSSTPAGKPALFPADERLLLPIIN